MKRKIVLHIDTSDREKTVVGLRIGKRLVTKVKQSGNFSSQSLLPLIDELLHEQKTGFQDLSAIEVFSGPGSYTGLRVGAAVANALGWILGIPVNGKKGKPVELEYKNR